MRSPLTQNSLLTRMERDRKEFESLFENPSDMNDPKVQKRMREVVEKATSKLNQLNDFDLGGTVRMLMRDSLMHEGIVCAARDRIYKLSLELADAKKKIAELEGK